MCKTEKELRQKTKANRVRGAKLSSKKRQNVEWRNDINEFMANHDLEDEQKDYLRTFVRRIDVCSTHTGYREHTGGAIELIGSHTCKHKMCNVCNYFRSKQLRRKYLNYFKRNELVDLKTGEIHQRNDFDYMHLTLTVPHAGGTWRGKQWYATELMEAYNYMRKRKWWLEMVFAGEFGVEVTRNANGLHIHIHSLLVVHKSRGNRNKLHKLIMEEWNRLTVDETSQRTAFADEELKAIVKGNNTMWIGLFQYLKFLIKRNPE